MRMWHKSLTPFLCKKHLLGAHGELHKHRSSFIFKQSINGRIFPIVHIEPLRMKQYHDELVEEFIKRGYKHQSEYIMPDLSYLSEDILLAKICLIENINCLCSRCIDCNKSIKEAQYDGKI